MSKPSSFRLLLQWFLFVLLCTVLFHGSNGDVGTAARYSPPYLPTACYGNAVSMFPTNNLFGSASEGIWDNQASCGRRYLVKCLSASVPGTCKPGVTIQITIVDRASSSVSRPSRDGTTMVLSETAFSMIANPTAAEINIEFTQI